MTFLAKKSVFSWQIIEFLNNLLEFFENLREFFFGLSFFGLEFFRNVQKKACITTYILRISWSCEGGGGS